MRRVSVIVPVRNEAAHIEETLECLSRQDFPHDDFEVIVVDGVSTDDTVPRVRAMQNRFAHLTLLMNPGHLSSAARNIAIRHASGQYHVIIDGHCAIRNPHYLRDLVHAFETSGADCLGRPQPLRAGNVTPFQEAVATARESWLGHNPDSAIYSDQPQMIAPENVAVAYRREVYERIGLFDEQFDACEDVEFNTRVGQAGLTCYFTPAIRVDYQARTSLGGLFYQMFRYGTGRARLGKKNPRSITVPSLVPPLWLLWLVLAPLVGLLSTTVALAFVFSLLLYSTAILVESLRIARRVPPRAWRSIPLIFLTIHVGFGWGYLREWARGLRFA